MSDKKQQRGLGRGLAALLPDAPLFVNEDTFNLEKISILDITQIIPNPHQPRRAFDDEKLAELAVSIKEHGLLQPLIVAKSDMDNYTIIAGERRWRAAQKLGFKQISCIIRSFEEQQIQELSLIENIQRVDLLPLEEARAYRDLIDQYNYTQEALAERLGKSRSHIANTLRLLNLPEKLRELLEEGSFTAGHARALLSLTNHEEQDFLANRIINESLNVRQSEQLAQELQKERLPKIPKETSTPSHPIFADIARRLKDKWGVKVAVHDNKGRGKIVIDYYCEDDLQRIIDSLLSETL
ncbi:MAG: ParB/RepB/Spo0J family partition protein [Firmicutes bacterium]|nr:ParB/RepB/Spo0J family partition protein [Bacillota bacterium]